MSVDEENPVTIHNMNEIQLDAFFDDIILDLASRVKSLLPQNAPISNPNLLPSLIPCNILRKTLVHDILPKIVKKHSVTIGTPEQAVWLRSDEIGSDVRPFPIVYGTPVATQLHSASSTSVVQSKFVFPTSAPAKLTQVEDDARFIEGENVIEDIRDVGTFAVGSSGGKNELRIKEEEEEQQKRYQQMANQEDLQPQEDYGEEGYVIYGEREGD